MEDKYSGSRIKWHLSCHDIRSTLWPIGLLNYKLSIWGCQRLSYYPVSSYSICTVFLLTPFCHGGIQPAPEKGRLQLRPQPYLFHQVPFFLTMFRPESLNYGRLHFLYGPLIVRGEKFLPKVGEEGRGVIIAFSIWTTVVQRRVFMVKLWGSTSCFDILSNPTREKNEEPFDTLLFFFFFFPSPLARHHPVAVRVVAAQKTFSLMIFSTHPIFPGTKTRSSSAQSAHVQDVHDCAGRLRESGCKFAAACPHFLTNLNFQIPKSIHVSRFHIQGESRMVIIVNTHFSLD